ncbi:MAG TPA: hypothetical protein VIV09_01005 [Pseudolabrys sp.]
MLEQCMIKGAQDACARLKLANPEAGMLGGLLGKAKSFGQGQLSAGKDLFSNLRGGFGKETPLPMGHEGPTISPEQFRGKAVGNLKTLAPTLLAGGGLYLMHRHNQQQQEQQRQQAQQQAMQGGYGQPMM